MKKEIYNSEYREFLSRDAMAWCKLSLFYTIFYTLLAGFFLLSLFIFYQTIDQKKPTYYNKDSVMHFKVVNPGMGFRPQIDPESDLIHVNMSNWKTTYEYLDLFMQKYEQNKNKTFTGAHGRQVAYDYEKIINETPCSRSKNYGYSSGTPCVAVKLNRIYGWLPIFEKKQKLPYNISKVTTTDKFVYVACTGENGYDRENMGPIEYYSSYPNQDIGGINFKYFPYRNQPNYLSQLVFVHFKSITRNTLINIECKAYASNIDNVERMHKRGMAKFQLFVTNK